VYHQYTVLAPNRDLLSAELRKRGVDSKPFYPRIVTQEPIYKDLGYGREKYPVAQNAAEHCLSLPVHPGVSEKDVRLVARSIREILAS
jgi:UDP-2-acetamido-2-deoxy-ribo-hexuluronate aminotransferase